MNDQASTPWWKHAVIYQIYPRSFRDTTGNGIGDIDGIIEKLDYLKWLGVDAIWLSPIFASPMVDFGYDVSNYVDIHPDFGTLDTVDSLIESAHARDLRVLMDFVPNHSSDRHEWFLESRASRENPKRDWYIWRDAKAGGSAPTNWVSYFGGSAWEWDEATQQYYLHSFLKEQPDLNWRNPAVVEAMHSVLRFWLDRGVDGFRVDAVLPVIKDDQFRDNPKREEKRFGKDIGEAGEQVRLYSENRPELHGIVRDIRSLADSYTGDRLLLGEVYTLDPETAAEYYGENDEFHLVLNVTLVNLPWDAGQMRKYIEAFDEATPAGAQPTLVLGSHDEPRLASRYGEQQARVAAVMLLTLKGTPLTYYGDELGMLDGEIGAEDSLDPWPGLSNLPHLSRDVARTPMQWDATDGAGFSAEPNGGEAVKPWLPVHPRSSKINVASERQDPNSILCLHGRLLELRKSSLALSRGSYRPLEGQPADVYAYLREFGGQRLAIALNLGGEDLKIKLPVDGSGTIVLSSHLDRNGEVELGEIEVRAHEGLVVGLD